MKIFSFEIINQGWSKQTVGINIVKHIRINNGKAVFFKTKVMKGNSIQSNCKISNLEYDEMHLSCNITKLKDNGEEIFTDKRLVYRIVDTT